LGKKTFFTKSSTNSLITDINNTKQKGAIAVAGSIGDRNGIDKRTAVKRKKILK